MSQKWIRSKRWDDEHIPAWAWPIKAILRALSSITLAVVLLVLVAIYGALASVPIGLVAMIPTYLIYGLTLAAAIALLAGLPAWVASKVLARLGAAPAPRFIAGFVLFAAMAAGTFLIWRQTAWPRLRYDFATHQGFMLFSSFVEQYRSTTLRRLPGMEMSELEFYSWWPLRLILLTFVVNMVVATVRRIEFTFVNIGVLTVHTGIVTIALGSIYYAGAKKEGDMLLRAGPPDESGKLTTGPIESGFFDNTQVVLWLGQTRPHGGSGGMEQRPIRGLPRYNDYNLNALNLPDAEEAARRHDRGRTLRIPVPPPPRPPAASGAPIVDPDIQFEIVGYASYAELEHRWVPSTDVPHGDIPTPMRRIDLISSLPPSHPTQDVQIEPGREAVIRSFTLLPDRPADRIGWIESAAAIEYTRGMPESRWRDLAEPLPDKAPHGLVVEVPGPDGAEPFRQVYAAQPGQRIEVGQTGYSIEVQSIAPQPPFPIITPGYQGARSSVAIVRVTPPPGPDGAPATPFTRYVYHRFPEINQDLSDELNERGMPKRSDADPAIRIGYIDASIPQVYLDELPDEEDKAPGAVRAIVRLPGRDPIISERLEQGQTLAMAPMIGLRLGERAAHARRVEVPVVVPEQRRERSAVGTHQSAAIAVRVSLPAADDRPAWEQTVWVPFVQYLGLDPGAARRVTTPDGRELTLIFGRYRHTLPGMGLQLVDFQMFPYPHSDVPQDYRSDLLVLTNWNGQFGQSVRPTSLNAPLLVRVPFQPRPDAPAWVNAIARAVFAIAPDQYKFSQAGWDAETWRQTKAMADAGQLPRPYVRYTILGVGNNPGIYIIAAGAVMMCVGIPWAFYLKPYLVRRRKKKLQAQLAAQAASRQPPPTPPPPTSTTATAGAQP